MPSQSRPAAAQPPLERKVVIYCRISDDRPGTGLGVARQQKACEDLCQEHGWTPLYPPFIDNDVSASSGAPRPRFEEMMQLLASGLANTVVVYAVDRLYRRVIELEGLLTLLESRPEVVVRTATGSNLDLTSRDGRVLARILVSLAQREAEMTSFRATNKHAELAAAGKPSGGARAYGYSKDHTSIVEPEAEIIREMAQRLIATRNVHAVVRWLQASDVKTARGGEWRTQTVRSLLLNPRLLGLRQHKGNLTPAVWPPILDQATSDQLRSILLDPERRTAPGNQAKHLLMRLVRCGRCGMYLATQTRGRSDPGQHTYACRRDPAAMVTGCGKLRMRGDWLDEWVAASALARLEADTELRAGLLRLASPVSVGPSMDELLSAREALLAREDEAGDMFAAGEIDRRQLARMTAMIGDERRSVDAALSRIEVASPAGALLAAEDLERGWEERSQEERRALLRLVIDHIVVRPARHGRNRFDPDRLQIVWRE